MDSSTGGEARNAETAAPVPRRRKRKTGGKHEDKVQQILRTAAQLFSENGYEATSLDTIADRVGIHKATLYHYVESKESILYQCLLRSFSDLDELEVEMADRSRPVLDRLHNFATRLAIAQNNDFGRCVVLIGARPLEALATAEIRDFQRRLDLIVRDLVTEGMVQGVIRPCNPGLVAAMLFGALNWVPRWYDEKGPMRLGEVVDEFMAMLVHGIEAQQGE